MRLHDGHETVVMEIGGRKSLLCSCGKTFSLTYRGCSAVDDDEEDIFTALEEGVEDEGSNRHV